MQRLTCQGMRNRSPIQSYSWKEDPDLSEFEPNVFHPDDTVEIVLGKISFAFFLSDSSDLTSVPILVRGSELSPGSGPARGPGWPVQSTPWHLRRFLMGWAFYWAAPAAVRSPVRETGSGPGG